MDKVNLTDKAGALILRQAQDEVGCRGFILRRVQDEVGRDSSTLTLSLSKCEGAFGRDARPRSARF